MRPEPGPFRYAVDAEIATQQVPRALAGRWDSSDPEWIWPRWCATEVVAKPLDTPILPLLTEGPVDITPWVRAGTEVHWVVVRQGGVLVAYGLAATSSGASCPVGRQEHRVMRS